MGTFGDGAWKEGRAGGASLVYVGLDAGQLDHVQANHAAVHIRATLACDHVVDSLQSLAKRNWDLAVNGSHACGSLASELAILDQRGEHGLILPNDRVTVAPVLYRVSDTSATIPSPQPLLDQPLGSFALPVDMDQAKRAIDRVVSEGQWAIWRVDGPTFSEMSHESHRRLLQWLGEHHARIWCAPVRDIATWRP